MWQEYLHEYAKVRPQTWATTATVTYDKELFCTILYFFLIPRSIILHFFILSMSVP